MPSIQKKKSAYPIFHSASLEQLTEIEILINDIKRRSLQINRPFSAVVTLYSVPFLCYLLFLNEWSPLKGFYQEKYQRYQNIGFYICYAESDISYMNAKYNWINNQIITWSNTPKYKKKFPNSRHDYLTILSNVERLFQDLDSIAINNLKIEMIAICNRINTLLEQAFYPLNQENFEQYSLPSLYRSVKSYFENYLKKYRSICEKKRFERAELHIENDLFLKILQVAAAFILQYVVIDRFIHYFFPQGIWQPPIPKIPNMLMSTEADDLIARLQEHKQKVEAQAKRHVKVARYGTVASFLFLFYLFLTDQTLSPQLMVFTLTAFATALVNIQQDVNDYYYRKTWRIRVATQENYIRLALGSSHCNIKRIVGEDMTFSYFLLHFGDKGLANLFKDCCLYHGVRVISRRATILSISNQRVLSAHQAQAIRRLFEESIRRKQGMKKLVDQMKKITGILLSKVDEIAIIPKRDEQYLPYMRFELLLPKSLSAECLEKLETSLAPYSYQSQETQEGMEIGLTGAEPIPEESFKSLIAMLTTWSRNEIESAKHKKDVPAPSEESYQEQSVKRGKKKTKAEKMKSQEENSEQAADEAAVRRIVRWRSAIYDSDVTTTISPLPFGIRRDKRSLYSARFFVTHALDWEKIPVEVRDAVKEKVESFVQAPKFASKQGGTGMAWWPSCAVDQNGRWFKTAAKLKLLGELGDVRCYVSEEVAPTGESLLTIKGIDLTAH